MRGEEGRSPVGPLKTLPPPRKQPRRRREIDVCDEQALLTVGLVAEQRPIGVHHGRSGWRAVAGKVDRGEIAGVLGGAAQGCFLMERVGGIGESRGPVTAGLALVE